ncbi:MAG TPA: carboxypeptidase-like regulatory domain-containing protein, partial [Candidatus Acidoferrales bacterium]|nr:carboxypeptidase-like regulatory domain-containing protein [Candidatus Acidoferrales bacterium]
MSTCHRYLASFTIAILLLSLSVAPVLAQASQPPQTKAFAPAQVSGHVFRADTGEPLAGALVTLSTTTAIPGTSDVSLRTAGDGSYTFTGVRPGAYYVLAFRAGFHGKFYGSDKRSLMCPAACVSVDPAQKLEAVDIRLTGDPPISQMNDDAIATAYPGLGGHLGFAMGRFSPDGKYFAAGLAAITYGATEQVWLYDLRSHGLAP